MTRRALVILAEVRAVLISLALVGSAAMAVAADQGRTSKPAPAPRTVTGGTPTCASDLGSGLTSRRTYCDVLITKSGQDSVFMSIPAHTGPAALHFDLHNRFTVPASGTPACEWFMRATALVAVVRPTGQVLERLAVRSEFRTIKDLFDRISGGAPPGGIKAVAPGKAESFRVIVPAGLNGAGIVGLKLEFSTLAQPSGSADTPGRPIAIVSNVRVEYVPK
jgi:hypothetical protein